MQKNIRMSQTGEGAVHNATNQWEFCYSGAVNATLISTVRQRACQKDRIKLK